MAMINAFGYLRQMQAETSEMHFHLRPAKVDDAANIIQLYYNVYGGAYPDPTFTNFDTFINTLASTNKRVFVATFDNQIVSCLLFYYDSSNKLGKAAGGVVDPKFRGHNLTQKMIQYGIDTLEASESGLEVVYVTTRTVHRAAQVLTEKMGFKKFGIFPNVHRTRTYETHALAALYRGAALEKRYTNFKHHPLIYKFFQFAAQEAGLPPMEVDHHLVEKKYDGEVGNLEVIEAKEYIKYRFNQQTKNDCIDFAFFPFAVPNVLITNPDQTIEIYAYINEVDKHCVIIGCKVDRLVSFTKLLRKVAWMLRDRGVRYVEMIARANRTNIIDKIIKAKFIPSGYLPALQCSLGIRYDYVIFSRSFEIFDFEHIELTGVNSHYLREYIRLWEEIYLGNNVKPTVGYLQ